MDIKRDIKPDLTMLGLSQATDDMKRDIDRVIRNTDALLDVPAWYLNTALIADELIAVGWRKP